MKSEGDNTQIMNAREITLRAFCLFAVWLINTPTPREDIFLWIKNNDLWNSFSPEELKFIETESPTRQQKIDFSWHIERLYVLAWALGEIEDMIPSDQQGTIAEFKKAISPLNANSCKRYLKKAKLRDEIEVWELADQIEKLHWEARNAKINGIRPNKPVNLEIIQERHHAINWILWGHEESWDEVTTDT